MHSRVAIVLGRSALPRPSAPAFRTAAPAAPRTVLCPQRHKFQVEHRTLAQPADKRRHAALAHRIAGEAGDDPAREDTSRDEAARWAGFAPAANEKRLEGVFASPSASTSCSKVDRDSDRVSVDHRDAMALRAHPRARAAESVRQ